MQQAKNIQRSCVQVGLLSLRCTVFHWPSVFFPFFSGGKEVELVVHIVQENRKKPFLGGYRHRLTGTEFHNAAAQTLPKIRVPSSVEKFHRDTQTYKLRNRLQQTTNTTSTQMVTFLEIFTLEVHLSIIMLQSVVKFPSVTFFFCM